MQNQSYDVTASLFLSDMALTKKTLLEQYYYPRQFKHEVVFKQAPD